MLRRSPGEGNSYPLQYSDGYWLVNFPQFGDKPDIATISVHQDDMVVIPKMDAQINERIKAAHQGKK